MLALKSGFVSDRENHVPQRPYPPEVYRRRRIAALVAIILVVALIWWFISRLGGNSDTENTASNTEVTTESVSPPNLPKPKDSTAASTAASGSQVAGESSSETTGESASESVSETAGESTTAETEQKEHRDTCSVNDLDLTAKPAKATFAAGELPSFFVTIENPTKADCVVDFDSSKLLFEVFRLDNYQRVWGDLDCNASDVTDTRTIEAGKSVNFELGAWSRTTSAPNQCDDRKPVDPGAFLLYAHVGDNVSEPATFNLS